MRWDIRRGKGECKLCGKFAVHAYVWETTRRAFVLVCSLCLEWQF